ncbi:UNKNOWN [Stylonychia lemnae]|uniref:Uncharacterized protein n=1 Tax=Stylonychia lemnae TaxID=5949 RepID=A0A077ZTI5_STYLE|nr:UNKNOWN [Stylonychia lemnae]|eukprot:CDW73197.1 UNKNOWN [Stylonychia lemnae]
MKLKQLIKETDKELNKRGIINLNELNQKKKHFPTNKAGNLYRKQEFNLKKLQATLNQQNSISNFQENQDRISISIINGYDESDEDDFSDQHLEKQIFMSDSSLENENMEGNLYNKY